MEVGKSVFGTESDAKSKPKPAPAAAAPAPAAAAPAAAQATAPAAAAPDSSDTEFTGGQVTGKVDLKFTKKKGEIHTIVWFPPSLKLKFFLRRAGVPRAARCQHCHPR